MAKRREAYKNQSEESKGKRREYVRKRRQQEGRQERESRLQASRRRSDERLDSETSQNGLKDWHFYNKQQLHELSQISEKRAERLNILRQNATARIELEMPEKRDEKLEVLRRNTANTVASETAEQRQNRLVSMRTNLAERTENESVPEREERLKVPRESVRERRANNVSFQEEHVDSHEEYLHQRGWEDTENPLHEQEWVRNEMGSFHSSQEQLQHRQCTVCKETWPTKQNLSKDPARYVCHRCMRDKKSLKAYSAENDMDPGIVPPQLQGLTQIEEMLIARVCLL